VASSAPPVAEDPPPAEPTTAGADPQAAVDVANEDDLAVKEQTKKYKVKGLPSMIVFGRKGKELARERGYVYAGRISKLLERAK
jgi:thioredoxin-related protein